jgi:hypothetical protein
MRVKAPGINPELCFYNNLLAHPFSGAGSGMPKKDYNSAMFKDLDYA